MIVHLENDFVWFSMIQNNFQRNNITIYKKIEISIYWFLYFGNSWLDINNGLFLFNKIEIY
jgi:hypothetical protein